VNPISSPKSTLALAEEDNSKKDFHFLENAWVPNQKATTELQMI
jgi:hypothetical protein